MRISTSMAHQQGLDAILDQQSKLQHTQLQLATGRRVVTPSDDPVASTLALDLEQIKRRNEQFDENADFAESRLNFTETTLGNVINTLQRARELAVQGLNGTMGPDDRLSIAAEVRELYDELMSLANSSDGSGEYIFAGFSSDQPPFTGNLAAGVKYEGDQGQRNLQIGPSRQVAVTDSGFEIFGKIPDPAGGGYKDVFSMMSDFITGLESDSPSSAVLDDIDSALDHLGIARSRIGGRINALDDQRNINEAYAIDLDRAKGELLDLDYAKAVSDYNVQMAGFQAAQSTFTKVQQLSLFNYL